MWVTNWASQSRASNVLLVLPSFESNADENFENHSRLGRDTAAAAPALASS